MLEYDAKLKKYSRLLRNKMTDSERKLWSRLRKKQILDVPFYRQKPIGQYIVDFYAPKAGLVVEVDGSQHFGEEQIKKDKQRDAYLHDHGLTVLRFDNLQVLQKMDGVMEVIFQVVTERLAGENPP
ncbi:MAG: endonuclease domain-containing protein [Deltaproteobacteria bacterium]|nr:endonuclease domain-containing protein [Deltaproteobacteria bacterium]